MKPAATPAMALLDRLTRVPHCFCCGGGGASCEKGGLGHAAAWCAADVTPRTSGACARLAPTSNPSTSALLSPFMPARSITPRLPKLPGLALAQPNCRRERQFNYPFLSGLPRSLCTAKQWNSYKLVSWRQ